jgi:hypothetical protein
MFQHLINSASDLVAHFGGCIMIKINMSPGTQDMFQIRELFYVHMIFCVEKLCTGEQLNQIFATTVFNKSGMIAYVLKAFP